MLCTAEAGGLVGHSVRRLEWFRQNVSSQLVVVVVLVIVTIPCYPYTGEILSPLTKCDLTSKEKYISDKMRNIKKSSQTSPRDRSEDDESFSSLSDSEPVEVGGLG